METQELCEECNNPIKLWFNKLMYFFNKKTIFVSRNEAFNKATYGRCMTKEQFVLQKQVSINTLIKERISNIDLYETDFEKYFIVLPFSETEDECSEEIFRPFIDEGYKIVKISEYLEILKGNNIYLLSWKEASY